MNVLPVRLVPPYRPLTEVDIRRPPLSQRGKDRRGEGRNGANGFHRVNHLHAVVAQAEADELEEATAEALAWCADTTSPFARVLTQDERRARG